MQFRNISGQNTKNREQANIVLPFLNFFSRTFSVHRFLNRDSPGIPHSVCISFSPQSDTVGSHRFEFFWIYSARIDRPGTVWARERKKETVVERTLWEIGKVWPSVTYPRFQRTQRNRYNIASKSEEGIYSWRKSFLFAAKVCQGKIPQWHCKKNPQPCMYNRPPPPDYNPVQFFCIPLSCSKHICIVCGCGYIKENSPTLSLPD